MEERPTRIMVKSTTNQEYQLRLARPITEIDDFEDEFQLFAHASENDVIKIDIVSPGGSVDTTHMICRAIAACEAHTIAYIGPTCASGGTAIALACEEWEVDDMSSFMVHTGSYGTYGMAPHVKAHVEHYDKMLERFVRHTYTGFLTEEEILQVLDAREVYFEGMELVKRLQAYSDYRESVRQAIYEESLDAERPSQ